MVFLIVGVSMQSCKEDKNAPANETVASQIYAATGYDNYVYIDLE